MSCKTCVNFTANREPKDGWISRKCEAKRKHPTISDDEAATLANNSELWELIDTGYGFCNFHEIEQEIPDHITCDDYEQR